jgi:hypothetical protein
LLSFVCETASILLRSDEAAGKHVDQSEGQTDFA